MTSVQAGTGHGDAERAARARQEFFGGRPLSDAEWTAVRSEIEVEAMRVAIAAIGWSETDERITSWERIVVHPFFRLAFADGPVLLPAMLRLLDAALAAARSGETSCASCGDRIVHNDPTGDGLAAWWSHEHHPSDGHDATARTGGDGAEVDREALVRAVITADIDWAGRNTSTWDRGASVVDALLAALGVTVEAGESRG